MVVEQRADPPRLPRTTPSSTVPASIIRRALMRRALYILMAPLGESTERNQKTALMSNGGENMVLADHGTVLPQDMMEGRAPNRDVAFPGCRRALLPGGGNGVPSLSVIAFSCLPRA